MSHKFTFIQEMVPFLFDFSYFQKHLSTFEKKVGYKTGPNSLSETNLTRGGNLVKAEVSISQSSILNFFTITCSQALDCSFEISSRPNEDRLSVKISNYSFRILSNVISGDLKTCQKKLYIFSFLHNFKLNHVIYIEFYEKISLIFKI